MHQDSVDAEDGDSCEYNQGGKDWYMPQDRVGAEKRASVCTTKAVRAATYLRTA